MPLGYDHLQRFYHTKNTLNFVKSDSNQKSRFDPVDASLLIQDELGNQLVSRLKYRVRSIDSGKAWPSMNRTLQSKSDQQRKSYSKETIRSTILSPAALKQIVEMTTASIGLGKEIVRPSTKDLNRVIMKMRAKKKDDKDSQFLRLFNDSKQSRDARDKHCLLREMGRLTEVRPTKNIFQKTASINNQSSLHDNSQFRRTGAEEIEINAIDPNRLPYLYMCPSI